MRVTVPFLAMAVLLCFAGCGSSGPAPDPQACASANDHLMQCNGPSPLFDPNACDSHATCQADCINQGSCADVLAFIGGNDSNPVGVCVGNCGQ